MASVVLDRGVCAQGRRLLPGVWLICLALVLPASGCDGENSFATHTSSRPRGVAAPGATPAPATPPGIGAPERQSITRFMQTPPEEQERPAAGSSPAGRPVAGAESTDAPAEVPILTEAEAQESRLREALARAFGSPQECIGRAARSTLNTHLTLRVSVVVTPSGRINRADISGGRLSAEDLGCMREHAMGLRLPGPIQNAPLNLSTQLEFGVRSTPPAPSLEGAQ